MGRKQDADSLQAKVKQAANQIKILDQKGVIDIYSIQLWFGALIGSFTLVYIIWSVFIVEDDPKSHFPAHMLGNTDTDQNLAQLNNEPQQVAFVVCDVTQIPAVLASIKSLILLSIRPVHLALLTQDTVMNKMLAQVEQLAWSMPGHVTFKFDYARENLYAEGEQVKCAQQKLLLPAELYESPPGRKSIKVPDSRLLVGSEHFLNLMTLDKLMKLGPTEKRQAMGVFYDNDTQPVDELIIYDLVKVSEATVYASCDQTITLDGQPWHQYEVWKAARERHPEMASTRAELAVLAECNPDYLARIDIELENGKRGLRQSFNRSVFQALQEAFQLTNERLQGFNEAAWAAFDRIGGADHDRLLLTRTIGMCDLCLSVICVR